MKTQHTPKPTTKPHRCLHTSKSSTNVKISIKSPSNTVGSGSDFRDPKKLARKKLPPISTKLHTSIDLVESVRPVVESYKMEVTRPRCGQFLFFILWKFSIIWPNGNCYKTFLRAVHMSVGVRRFVPWTWSRTGPWERQTNMNTGQWRSMT